MTGVMPQTKEVIELVKAESDHVGLVVAINKVDKPGVDIVSAPLTAAQLYGAAEYRLSIRPKSNPRWEPREFC